MTMTNGQYCKPIVTCLIAILMFGCTRPPTGSFQYHAVASQVKVDGVVDSSAEVYEGLDGEYILMSKTVQSPLLVMPLMDNIAYCDNSCFRLNGDTLTLIKKLSGYRGGVSPNDHDPQFRQTPAGWVFSTERGQRVQVQVAENKLDEFLGE